MSYVHLQHISAASINGILLRARQAKHCLMHTALYRARLKSLPVRCSLMMQPLMLTLVVSLEDLVSSEALL